MLRPFDSKPFGRKLIGRAGEKAGKQSKGPAAEEEKALERLEQAGVDIVQLFRAATESLMAQASGGVHEAVEARRQAVYDAHAAAARQADGNSR